MRDLSTSLAARLGDATTICLCWQITLADGTQIAVTDHDEDVTIAGLTHLAGSGWQAGALEQRLGLQVSTTQITGAISVAPLDAASLMEGALDGAQVATFAVDWTKPAAALLVDRSTIGTVTVEDGQFVAELRSPAQQFEAASGRLFQKGCDAELGDARCGVALEPLTQTAHVTGGDGDLRVGVMATGRAAGWFVNGLLITPAGERLRIRAHRADENGDSLTLWSRPHRPLAPGAAVALVAGCDHSHETCRDRFANVANFRGFPHMPGNDLVLAYAHAGDVAMDGGSLFR